MQNTRRNTFLGIFWLCFVLALFFCAAARAEMKVFPMWELKTCSAQQYACYTFEQSKVIAELDIDLQYRLAACDLCNDSLDGAMQSLLKAEHSIDDFKLAIVDSEKRLEEKQAVLAETTLKLEKADRYNVFGAALPWVLTSIIVVGAGAFVTGWLLATK